MVVVITAFVVVITAVIVVITAVIFVITAVIITFGLNASSHLHPLFFFLSLIPSEVDLFSLQL